LGAVFGFLNETLTGSSEKGKLDKKLDELIKRIDTLKN